MSLNVSLPYNIRPLNGNGLVIYSHAGEGGALYLMDIYGVTLPLSGFVTGGAGATNGLHIDSVSGKVYMGGPLHEDVLIDGGDDYDFDFANIDAFSVSAIGDIIFEQRVSDDAVSPTSVVRQDQFTVDGDALPYYRAYFENNGTTVLYSVAIGDVSLTGLGTGASLAINMSDSNAASFRFDLKSPLVLAMYFGGINPYYQYNKAFTAVAAVGANTDIHSHGQSFKFNERVSGNGGNGMVRVNIEKTNFPLQTALTVTKSQGTVNTMSRAIYISGAVGDSVTRTLSAIDNYPFVKNGGMLTFAIRINGTLTRYDENTSALILGCQLYVSDGAGDYATATVSGQAVTIANDVNLFQPLASGTSWNVGTDILTISVNDTLGVGATPVKSFVLIPTISYSGALAPTSQVDFRNLEIVMIS